MSEKELEAMREATRRLCAELGLRVLPYGQAWWIVGRGVSRVVADLAGVGRDQLRPLPVARRKGF